MLMLMITLLVLGYLPRRRPGNQMKTQVFAWVLECMRTENLLRRVMDYPEGLGLWQNHQYRHPAATHHLIQRHLQRRSDMAQVLEVDQGSVHPHHIYKVSETMEIEGESKNSTNIRHIRPENKYV